MGKSSGVVSPEVVISPSSPHPLHSLPSSSNGDIPSGVISIDDNHIESSPLPSSIIVVCRSKDTVSSPSPSTSKRSSMPTVTTLSTKQSEDTSRRISITRAVESFRERRSKVSIDKVSSSKGEKNRFVCGYASLSNTNHNNDNDEQSPGYWSEPVASSMKEENCEQLVGKAAEEYLSSLGDSATNLLRKTINNGERKEDEYFMWMKKSTGSKMVIVSVKCVENQLSGQGGRRVKWRNVSTGRVSIYRYSIAVIPIGFGTRIMRSIRLHRKLCLIMVWLIFVGLICLTVVLGSIGNDNIEGGTRSSNSRIG